MHKQAIVPCVITFNILISACGKSNQLKQALEVFAAMKQHGVVPNVVTFNALISAYKRCNKL